MADSNDQVTITAQCFCKANTFTTSVPKSSLPLEGSFCHCNSCRHLTGALYTGDTKWPGSWDDTDVSGLGSYPFSKNFNVLFCPTCFTTMFFQAHVERYYGVLTGVLSNVPNLFRFGENIFANDTKDGGASCWLQSPNPDGSKAPPKADREAITETPSDWPLIKTLPTADAKTGPDQLPIQCICKGVNYKVQRWNGTPGSDGQTPWYIDPKNHKYYASFCACDSCRFSFAVEVGNFTFAPLSLVSYDEKGEKPFPTNISEINAAIDAKSDPRLGTLTYYKSSPDVSRYYCSHCAAFIFYAVEDRPEIFDIAVGTLVAPDGARAEDFLSWNFGAISFIEDSKGGWREGLTACVKKEAEAWRIRRGYPKSYRRVEQEEKEKETS